MSAYREARRYLARFVDLELGGMAAEAMGLDRIRALLAALGDPQTCYPSVLVAGTKGKGSTAAMVERALRAAGYRTGLYTQPHLHTIRERVSIDGELIPPDAFAEALNRVRVALPLAAGRAEEVLASMTAYEVMTALAFDYFARRAADIAIVEVGLGGRLDATNVLDAALSVITPISLDHTQVLGGTLEAIAREKADIIKQSRPCVSAPQAPEATAVICSFAEARGSPLRTACQDGARWERRSDGGSDLVTARGRIGDVHLALRGSFQKTNSAVAATVLDALHQSGTASADLEAVRAGLERVEWPGRFEVVEGGKRLPPLPLGEGWGEGRGPPIVLDGAHNVESVRALRQALYDEYGDRPLVLVLGIGADKDIPGIVRALLPARHVFAVCARHPRAADAAMIAAEARAAGAQTTIAANVAQALGAALERASGDDVVVATGSLYVVAEAREALGLARAYDEPAFDPWAAR